MSETNDLLSENQMLKNDVKMLLSLWREELIKRYQAEVQFELLGHQWHSR